MSRINALIRPLSLSVFLVTFTVNAEDLDCPNVGPHYGPPSDGARDMPGAMGIREYKPCGWQAGKETSWKDTDSVSPGIAGCHVETMGTAEAKGRHFGEACLDDTLLVESNPAAGVIHNHRNDIGHPDVFNCNDWCKGTSRTSGSKYSGGTCEAVTKDNAPPPCSASAMCVCVE